MIQAHIGEIWALFTALFWAISAVVFESASKKVGSLSVNFMKLIIALLLVCIYTFITRGLVLPVDASINNWFWLLLSGFVGFFLGDLFLFQAYVEVGSRISMVIMSVVPPITAIMSYIILGEKLTKFNIIGMIITVTGIAMVVLKKKEGEKKIEFSHSNKGIIYAFLGALGQAVGMILSKLGIENYNAFAAAEIRLIAGIFGFTILFFIKKKWKDISIALSDKKSLFRISIGSVFGPFLGVSFSLLAIQYTTTGVVSTITSIVPVLIIPPAIIIFKEKITFKELCGSLMTIFGVAILFMM